MRHARVAILISGAGSNMAALIGAMRGDFPARPAVVVASTPAAGGLGRAQALGVATVAVDQRQFGSDRAGFEAELTAILTRADADIVCLAGFMRILSRGFSDHWRGRLLNIHPSLLPKYPGLKTHARAIEASDTIAGCTVHAVTATLDAGPILGQARVKIVPNDTAQTLAARVLVQEHILYPAVLRRQVLGDQTPVFLG